MQVPVRVPLLLTLRRGPARTRELAAKVLNTAAGVAVAIVAVKLVSLLMGTGPLPGFIEILTLFAAACAACVLIEVRSAVPAPPGD